MDESTSLAVIDALREQDLPLFIELSRKSIENEVGRLNLIAGLNHAPLKIFL